MLEKWQAAPPDAALFLATEMTDGSLLETIRIPTMLLDCDLWEYTSDKVLIDNRNGIRKALRYLYEKGHREIGYFHSQYSIRNFEERGQAYREGLCGAGASFPGGERVSRASRYGGSVRSDLRDAEKRPEAAGRLYCGKRHHRLLRG